MPDKRERDCWWAFIAGLPEIDWNPPKKLKSDASIRKGRRYGRGYSPEPDSPEDPLAQETWHINDEGEVELALLDDPTESLPTPSGTPAPDPQSLQTKAILQDQEFSSVVVQREPTPSLAAYLDHVRRKSRQVYCY